MADSKLDLVLKETSRSVDPIIKKILNAYVDTENQEIIEYQIKAGGKRLRPALAIISCQMLGGKLKDVLYPAAGLEILHNYSLIVDDIVDNSKLRRGKPTTWAKFGRSIAQCVAADYSAAVFQAANQSKKSSRISELFAKAIKEIINGEVLDILFEQVGRENESYVLKNRYSRITDKDYFKMLGKKTAFLFQVCCEIGGICAQAKERDIKALKDFGYNFGIAFQIRDDVLDIFGQKEKFGKEIGKDIIERKLGNIIILLTLKELNSADEKRLLKIMRKGKVEEKDVKEVIKLIKKTNSYQKANLLGKKFTERARKNLNFLPRNKWSSILKMFSNFTIERET